MAKILVVDDHAENRELLVAVLGPKGHRLLQASDGAEALTLVRAERPELIITDILMPTMDGFEFVQQLRRDPTLSPTPVIFYTASYHESEAKRLAEACGVRHRIDKPSSPVEILATVQAALHPSSSGQASPPPGAKFDRQHVSLLATKLSGKVNALFTANRRLAALVDLGQQLVLEHDPLRLLETFCHSARYLIAAQYAAVGILDEDNPGEARPLVSSGMDPATAARIASLPAIRELRSKVLAHNRLVRASNVRDEKEQGSQGVDVLIRSYLGVPIGTPARIYGFLSVANKVGAPDFTDEDESIVRALAAQAAVAYENARHFDAIQKEMAERRRLEEALARERNLLRTLIDNLPDCIYVKDTESRFLVANNGLARLLGAKTAEQFLGKTDFDFFPRELAARYHADERAILASGEALINREEPTVDGAGNSKWLLTTKVPLRDGLGKVAGLVAVSRDITERKRVAETLRELSGRLLRLQDEERRRIARELHDSTAQGLAVMVISLKMVDQEGAGLSRRARNALADAIAVAQQCAQEIRTLSYLLHPPLLDEFGLADALRGYVRGFDQRSGIHVDLQMPEELRRLPRAVEMTLFRIVQESLVNIQRHSGSKKADIRMILDSTQATLEVKDYGRGIKSNGQSLKDGVQSLGVGIYGMRERVRQLGGELEIDSDQKGTTVRVMLPASEEKS